MEFPELLVHVRHGESLIQSLRGNSRYFPDDNSRQPFLGLNDKHIPLTNKGKKEASETGVRLLERYGKFDVVLHSQYLRSKQTAEALIRSYTKVESKDINFVETELLNERSMGEVFNLTEKEVNERFPELKDHWTKEGEIRAQYPRGDSLANVRQRMLSLLILISRIWPGNKICLVGHWGTSMMLRGIIEEISDSDLLQLMADEYPPNCSILAYEYDPNKNRLDLKEKNLVICT
jgi:broad specificity phosphatase PhoE